MYLYITLLGGTMLTFEEKLAIIESSFPELTRKDVSMKRVNFHYEESIHEKKIVVYHLHPNGNGFVYAELIEDGYDTDERGMVNIREFTEDELKQIVRQAIDSLSPKDPVEEIWVNKENQVLKLVYDFDLYNIYAGDLLDGTFTSYSSAASYLEEEGFRKTEK